jgi:hypothetical protein
MVDIVQMVYVSGTCLEPMMLYHIEDSTARRSVEGRIDSRRAAIRDDLVIEALQPLDVLQIGCRGQVLDGDHGTAAVRKVGSLQEAISVIAQHEFDVIVLGSGVADAWPTAAYDQIATLAGRTPVVVQTDYVAPMASLKQRHDREHDIIVATTKPSLLARLMLAAILRSRAFAEDPGAQIS